MLKLSKTYGCRVVGAKKHDHPDMPVCPETNTDQDHDTYYSGSVGRLVEWRSYLHYRSVAKLPITPITPITIINTKLQQPSSSWPSLSSPSLFCPFQHSHRDSSNHNNHHHHNDDIIFALPVRIIFSIIVVNVITIIMTIIFVLRMKITCIFLTTQVMVYMASVKRSGELSWKSIILHSVIIMLGASNFIAQFFIWAVLSVWCTVNVQTIVWFTTPTPPINQGKS